MVRKKITHYISFLKISLSAHTIALILLLATGSRAYQDAKNFEPVVFSCSGYLDLVNGIADVFIIFSFLVFIPFGVYSLWRIRSRLFTTLKIIVYIISVYVLMFSYWTKDWCILDSDGNNFQPAVIISIGTVALHCIFIYCEYWYFVRRKN